MPQESRREILLHHELLESNIVRIGKDHPTSRLILTEAEKLLAERAESVLDKKHMPPSEDMKDYFSLSIYYWPDETSPNGLPYKARDGLINPECDSYDRPAFERMTWRVDTLALAFALSHDERFADKAITLLDTWFIDPRTSMNPNMLYAQYIPGADERSGWKDYPNRFVPGKNGRKGIYVSFGGVIEDLSLVPLLDSIRLLQKSTHWTERMSTGLKSWYARYTDWLLTHQHGLDEAACRNNHGSWYWADILAFLEFIGEKRKAKEFSEKMIPQRMDIQFEKDGSQPEELVRAISKNYCTFSLISFINMAIVAERCGYDAWNVETAEGKSIRKAVDWFLPFFTGKAEWKWKQVKPFHEAALAGVFKFASLHYENSEYLAALRNLHIAKDDRVHLLFGPWD
jgi:hypothetical protein